MKSTYKLIGVFWDGKPEASGRAAVVPYDPYYLPLSAQPCLLDLIERKRRVGLSQLLGIGSQEDVMSLAEKLEGCGSVAVVVDYLPKAKSSVHRRFFEHRALQALKALSEALPSTEIVFMTPQETKAAA